MESAELTRLQSFISSLQTIGKSLQEGQHVDSSEILSITDSLPGIVSSLVQSDSLKDRPLLPRLGSTLVTILSSPSLPVTRVSALNCLISCLRYSNDLIGIEKTKKKATNFALEQFDHHIGSVRYSCVAWLSLLPSLSKPGPLGEKFALEWEQTMQSSLASLQLALSAVSPDLPHGRLSADTHLPLPSISLPSQQARRVDSLFQLIVCLLSRRSPARVSIPMESILHLVTSATQHTSQENQTCEHVAEVCSFAWRFLKRLSEIIPSCLPPFSQPVSALFLRAMSSYKAGAAMVAMLQCLSTWLEVCQVGVSSPLLHQFLSFLKRHSSLRAPPHFVPNRVKRRKISSKRKEAHYLTDMDNVQSAIECIGVCSSLVRNCVTEISDSEYNSFMAHVLSLLEVSTQLQNLSPTEPLILSYKFQLYSLLSDCILHSHPLTLSHMPSLIPHLKQGLSSPHLPIRQVCRTGTLLIEASSHPTLPPVKSAPNIPFIHSNTLTLPHTDLHREAISQSPSPPSLSLERIQTHDQILVLSPEGIGLFPPETATGIKRSRGDDTQAETYTLITSNDTSNTLDSDTYNTLVDESVGCFIKSTINFSEKEDTAETERINPATEAELNFDEIDSNNISGMLKHFVEAEPDTVESTRFSL